MKRHTISSISRPIQSMPNTKDAMNWYKSLDLDQRINLKGLAKSIGGIQFEDLTLLFRLDECIYMLYNKLKQEGFNIP